MSKIGRPVPGSRGRASYFAHMSKIGLQKQRAGPGPAPQQGRSAVPDGPTVGQVCGALTKNFSGIFRTNTINSKLCRTEKPRGQGQTHH
ncbi:hypothetical protein NY78_0760 [Desulfovibrio sp. TomC]|nr:hypothetical protein NY78_0760 [Desulfovibrio sp. TomC]